MDENKDTKTPAEPQNEDQSKPTLPPSVRANLPPEIQQNAQKPEEKADNSKAVKKPKKKKKFPVLGCFVGFLFLYLLSVVLGIFVLWLNRENTSFMGNFGFIDDVQLKDFILSSIQWSFFPLALLFLILTIVGIFFIATAKKDQTDRRKKGIRMTITNLIILIVLIPIWIGIYNFVFNLPVSETRTLRAEIITIPEKTSDLVAPVSINFSVENIQKVLARKNLVITKREWDFDGNNEFETETYEMVITHLFTSKGTFPVNVKVTTNDNKESIYSKTIVIPNAVFEADPESGPAPLEVTFNAAALTIGERIQLYRWDFDDDKKFDEETSSAEIKYTFDKIGTYNVNLQTVDDNNNIKNYIRSVEVERGELIDLKPIIKVTPSEEGTIPFQVQFNAGESRSPSGKISKFEWDFGDGTPIKSGEKQNYIYKKAGTFTVELSISDNEGYRESSTVDIIVRAKATEPEAILKTDPPFNENSNTLNGTIPFTVEFDASKSIDKDDNITDYTWDFDGDEEYDEYGDKVTHIFREAGTYTIYLKVIDADEQESNASITVTVKETETKAIINCREPVSCSGPIALTVEFDATQSTTSDGSDIVNYEWDFGDGSGVIPTGAITSHLYTKVGTYKVKLKTFSSSGLEAETVKTVFARIVPLQACFEVSRTSGKAPLTVSFDSSCSTGTIKNWKWSFGDGFTSDARKPTHTFKKSGNYTVLLEITDPKNNVSKYSMAINAQ